MELVRQRVVRVTVPKEPTDRKGPNKQLSSPNLPFRDFPTINYYYITNQCYTMRIPIANPTNLVNI